MSEWKTSLEDVTDSNKWIEVHGSCDSADRAEQQVVRKMSDLTAMDLIRMY